MEFFAAAFFFVQFLRAPPPAAGLWAVVGACLGAAFAGRTALVAAFRSGRSRIAICCAAGAAAALSSPAPHPPTDRPRATTLDAAPRVVRAEGTVEDDLSRPGEAARFRLGGGIVVRVFGAARAPLPGAVVSAVGRLDADGGRLDVFDPAALRILQAPSAFAPRTAAMRWRRLALDRLTRAVPCEKARGLLAATAFGTPTLPEELRDDLVRSGTLHLIAVSGTHLALLAAGLRRATPRLRWLLPALVAYAAIAGMAAPVARSLFLATSVLVGRRFGHRARPVAHLAIAACVITAIEPTALFEPGFQLSFAAFAGLAASEPSRSIEDPFAQTETPPRFARLREGLRSGAAATLAAAPTTAWCFLRVAPTAPFATLLMAPLIPALLAAAAAAVAAPECSAPGRIAEMLTAATMRAAALLAAVPGASVDLARPTLPAFGFFAAAVAAALVRAGRGEKLCGSLVPLLGTAALLLVPDRAAPGCYVLDARRGSAALLLGRSAAFLIDTGPPEADVAAQILRLGVDRLDAAIISHAHLDHAGGLREVRRRLTVGTVYAPEAEARLLLNAGLGPVRVISRGDLLRVDEVSLDVLWPPHGRRSRDRNDSGAVIAAEIDRFRVLFPADLEAPGLRGLLQVGRPAPVSLLLAPHHGSANAAWDALLRAVQPRFVAVSARAGFPSPAVLGLAERCGAEVRATFSEGTLVYPAAR